MGQLGLQAIVGEVVVLHHFVDRRESGLAGEQDDAHFGQAEHLADALHKAQTRIVGLHDHIGQHHRKVTVPGQQAGRLGEAIGLHQHQRTT